MKKILILLILLLLPAIVSAAGVQVNVDQSTNLRVEVLRYEPYPASPGEYMDVWLAVETVQTSTKTIYGDNNAKVIQNGKLTLIDSYPFSSDGDSDQFKMFGSMGINERSVVKFKVRVDENAVEGENDLKFKFTSTNNPLGVDLPALKIDVRSLDIRLAITEILTEPEQMIPGQEGKLTLKVRNDGGSRVRDVVFKLNIEGSDMPFAPINSGTEKKLKAIGPEEEAIIEYELVTLADAEAMIYKVPINMSYYDETGTEYTKTEIVGVRVGADPDFVINLEETDIYSKRQNGEVVLSISNTGPSELKYLTLQIAESDKYEIIGKDSEYLGNLEPDDFESAQFRLYPKKSDVEILVKVIYKDTYNNQMEEIIPVKLPLYPSWKLNAYGLNGQTGTMIGTLIIYILLGLFLYYGYGIWKKEKRFDLAVKGGLKMTVISIIRLLRWLRWRNLKRLPRMIKIFLKQV